MKFFKKLLLLTATVTLLVGVNASAQVINYDEETGECYITGEASQETALVSEESENSLLGKAKFDAPTEFKWIGNKMVYSFKRVENGSGKYLISLWYKGEASPRYSIIDYIGSYQDEYVTHGMDPDWAENLESGEIYLTISVEGNESYDSSDVLTSPTIKYVKPDKKLSVPTNICWKETTGYALLPDYPGATGEIGYSFQLYYKPYGGGVDDYRIIAGVHYRPLRDGSFLNEALADFTRDIKDPGNYKFRVKALSPNISEYQDSDWSDWSEEIDTKNISNPIASELNEKINGGASADELKAVLTAKKASELAVALQANEEAANSFKKAEDIYATDKGITVGSEVSDEVSDKIIGKPSIIGAAFNAKDGTSEMTLNVGKSTQEVKYDKQKYENAVQISMKLNGAADSSKLDVPVNILLPVPTGVNAYGITIIHLHNNGDYEEINPVIKVIDGKSYMSFFLTSFSNFAIVNKKENPAPDPFFTDVTDKDWFYNAVKYAKDNNIMSGNPDGTFKPLEPCTRDMMVKILYNAAGSPAAAGDNPFTDCIKGKWYFDAVLWAKNVGVTSGKTSTFFGVGEPVTREQMAMFLYNYARICGYDITGRADISSFNDASSIDGWALEAVKWANYNGIINGNKDKTINPRGNASRCEVAQMVMMFMKKFGK